MDMLFHGQVGIMALAYFLHIIIVFFHLLHELVFRYNVNTRPEPDAKCTSGS